MDWLEYLPIALVVVATVFAVMKAKKVEGLATEAKEFGDAIVNALSADSEGKESLTATEIGKILKEGNDVIQKLREKDES